MIEPPLPTKTKPPTFNVYVTSKPHFSNKTLGVLLEFDALDKILHHWIGFGTLRMIRRVVFLSFFGIIFGIARGNSVTEYNACCVGLNSCWFSLY